MSMVSVIAGGVGMLSHSGAEAMRVTTASPLLRQFECALSSSATFAALSSLCSSLSRVLGCFSDCRYAVHVMSVIIGGGGGQGVGLPGERDSRSFRSFT